VKKVHRQFKKAVTSTYWARKEAKIAQLAKREGFEVKTAAKNAVAAAKKAVKRSTKAQKDAKKVVKVKKKTKADLHEIGAKKRYHVEKAKEQAQKKADDKKEADKKAAYKKRVLQREVAAKKDRKEKLEDQKKKLAASKKADAKRKETAGKAAAAKRKADDQKTKVKHSWTNTKAYHHAMRKLLKLMKYVKVLRVKRDEVQHGRKAILLKIRHAKAAIWAIKSTFKSKMIRTFKKKKAKKTKSKKKKAKKTKSLVTLVAAKKENVKHLRPFHPEVNNAAASVKEASSIVHESRPRNLRRKLQALRSQRDQLEDGEKKDAVQDKINQLKDKKKQVHENLEEQDSKDWQKFADP